VGQAFSLLLREIPGKEFNDFHIFFRFIVISWIFVIFVRFILCLMAGYGVLHHFVMLFAVLYSASTLPL
jgi:hypothetical protein